jgi:hypothetical protein
MKKLSDEDLKDKKEGIYLTGMPMFSSDPLNGFGYGGEGFLYFNGKRSDPFFAYVPYKAELSIELFNTSRNTRTLMVGLDMPYIFKTKWRLKAGAGYEGGPNFLYFGNTEETLKGLSYFAQEDMKQWRKKQDEKELSTDTPIHPKALTRTISNHAADDAIIVCDTGTITVWGARNFNLRGSQRFTLSGGLASMAFALPASIGAQLLYPSKQVIAICGDGGFAMLMADFATAVRYKLPVKIFVFNNSKLGLIQMEQEANAGNPEFQTCLHNPDYAKFADICGGKGYTVNEFSQLECTVAEALTSDKACIVNVKVNPEEITYPPHITVRHAFNYTKAKIAELFT